MLETPRAVADRLRRSAFAFPLVALAALAMLVISELSYWRASASMDELGERAVARTTLQLLHRLMLDAESGQRGYLLTGRSSYLVPYREANEEIQNTNAVPSGVSSWRNWRNKNGSYCQPIPSF